MTQLLQFQGHWVSMGVPSDGSYGVEKGLIFSFPVSIKPGGSYTVIQGLNINGFAKEKLEATQNELIEERDQALEACANWVLSIDVTKYLWVETFEVSLFSTFGGLV